MIRQLVAALPLFALAGFAQAAPVVSVTSTLPAQSQIGAPIPTYTSEGGYYTTVSPGDPSDATYVGLTQTYPNIAKSPFEQVPGYEGTPYDSVSGLLRKLRPSRRAALRRRRFSSAATRSRSSTVRPTLTTT
jgi:hypothetical protein